MMKIPIKMPQLGESIAEGKVTKWLKRVGEAVERDENLLEVMTDKVTVEIPCISKGKLAEIIIQEDQTAKVGEILGYIEGEGAKISERHVRTQSGGESPAAAPAKGASTAAPIAPPPPRAKSGAGVEVPPGVRTFAEEMGVDLSQVVGTGEGGRIRRQDVVAYLAKQTKKEAPLVAPKAPEPTLAEGDKWNPLTEMRRSIAHHMSLSKQTIPHVMTAHEVDMSRVVESREKNPDKPSITAYLVSATALALKKFLAVNSVYAEKGILQRKAVNIGVAVATEDGLLVPVVRNADQKRLKPLAAEVKDLAERARTKKLHPDEVHGGTFTITNPGVFNSLISAPIIPVGQSGILGVGAMIKRPVVRQDKVEVRPIVILSLSFDHRTFDGSTADQFLEEIRKNLEEGKWNE